MDVNVFFNNLQCHISEAWRHQFSCDPRILSECSNKLPNYCYSLATLKSYVVNQEDLQNLLFRLYDLAWGLHTRFELLLDGKFSSIKFPFQISCWILEDFNDNAVPNRGYSPPMVEEAVGRPKYDISKEQLLHLRELRFNWISISKMLHISRRTLYRHKTNLGIQESLVQDHELNLILRNILTQTPKFMFWEV